VEQEVDLRDEGDMSAADERVPGGEELARLLHAFLLEEGENDAKGAERPSEPEHDVARTPMDDNVHAKKKKRRNKKRDAARSKLDTILEQDEPCSSDDEIIQHDLSNLIWKLQTEPGECFHGLYHMGCNYGMKKAVIDDVRGRTVPLTHSRAFGPGPVDWILRRAWYAWDQYVTGDMKDTDEDEHEEEDKNDSDDEHEEDEADLYKHLSNCEANLNANGAETARMDNRGYKMDDEQDTEARVLRECWEKYFENEEEDEDDEEGYTDESEGDDEALTYKKVPNDTKPTDVVVYSSGSVYGYVPLHVN
jgi:hypothetical protein